MAQHQGPKPSAQPRTLRSEVLKKSTPAGFPDDLPYDAAAGVPADVSGGEYKPNVPEGGATPASPLPESNPFKLGPQ